MKEGSYFVEIRNRVSKMKWELGDPNWRTISELMDKLRKRKYTEKDKEGFYKQLIHLLDKL